MSQLICSCGSKPELIHSRLNHVRCMQIACACGLAGAEFAYVNALDKMSVEKTAITAWNLKCPIDHSLSA